MHVPLQSLIRLIQAASGEISVELQSCGNRWSYNGLMTLNERLNEQSKQTAAVCLNIRPKPARASTGKRSKSRAIKQESASGRGKIKEAVHI